jgi:hypothetical protein
VLVRAIGTEKPKRNSKFATGEEETQKGAAACSNQQPLFVFVPLRKTRLTTLADRAQKPPAVFLETSSDGPRVEDVATAGRKF